LDKESLFSISSDSLDEIKPISEIFDLNGKVAVVTGTVGLALNVINRLGECGAKVVCGSRSEKWGKLAEETMRERGFEVRFHKTDVREVSDCYSLVEFTEKTYGTVDIVVPAAAVWGARAFVDMKEEEWDDVIDTDLKGQYFTVQAAARSMIRGDKGGKVVTVASVAYRGDDMIKVAMMTNYNAAKAGVVGLTKGVAKELKQYGINVNCVAPGGMITPGAIMNNLKSLELYGEEWDHDVHTYGSATPIATTPDEVALMILTMCTDVSDFMYGQVIEVDGGSQFSFQAQPWSYTMEGGKHAA
jgi:NAD(P)-dependent dehydrogenase (short-subunit alcohol dehydrogenase family)